MCGKCPWVGGCCIFLLKFFDLVLYEIGSDVWLLFLDRVLMKIGSWSSTVLIVMFFIFGLVWTVSFSAPLEIVAGLFSWSPLEVGTQYFSGFAWFFIRGACDILFWLGFIVPFENIVLTASIAAKCELQMLAGISFSAAVKNWIACVILSSTVICGYSWYRHN